MKDERYDLLLLLVPVILYVLYFLYFFTIKPFIELHKYKKYKVIHEIMFRCGLPLEYECNYPLIFLFHYYSIIGVYKRGLLIDIKDFKVKYRVRFGILKGKLHISVEAKSIAPKKGVTEKYLKLMKKDFNFNPKDLDEVYGKIVIKEKVDHDGDKLSSIDYFRHVIYTLSDLDYEHFIILNIFKLKKFTKTYFINCLTKYEKEGRFEDTDINGNEINKSLEHFCELGLLKKDKDTYKVLYF